MANPNAGSYEVRANQAAYKYVRAAAAITAFGAVGLNSTGELVHPALGGVVYGIAMENGAIGDLVAVCMEDGAIVPMRLDAGPFVAGATAVMSSATTGIGTPLAGGAGVLRGVIGTPIEANTTAGNHVRVQIRINNQAQSA